jgi:hypothetical protein
MMSCALINDSGLECFGYDEQKSKRGDNELQWEGDG